MSPQRIQLRRTKGWRKPEGAVSVARPTKWGNPYRIVADDSGEREGWWVRYEGDAAIPTFPVGFSDTIEGARLAATDAFRDLMNMLIKINGVTDDDLAPLEGKDLACWCPLDQPCHADVLLELANEGASDG